MSFGEAPKKAFVKLAQLLSKEHGIQCIETKPLWACEASNASLSRLPNINFSVIANAKGETKQIIMPPKAYMKADERRPGIAYILLTPAERNEVGKKAGEEYWILGAQFLHNYYSIYDFDNKKIGLVESKTSAIDSKKPL